MLHIFLRVNSLVAMLSIEHLFSFSSFCQLAHLRYSWFSLVHRICWKVQRRLKIAHQLIVSIHMLNPTFIHFNHCISLLSKSHKNRVCIFNCVYMCIYIYIYIHFSFYNKYILSCTGYTYNLPVFFHTLKHSSTQAQLRGICVISTAAYGLKEANFVEATGFKWWPRVSKLPVDDKTL